MSSVAERIQRLLALTTSHNAHEADLAATRARDLLARHSLSAIVAPEFCGTLGEAAKAGAVRLRTIPQRGSTIPRPATPARGPQGRLYTLLDLETDRQETFTIVPAERRQAARGWISPQSPVARALAGHHPGDAITIATPGGSLRYRVIAVEVCDTAS